MSPIGAWQLDRVKQKGPSRQQQTPARGRSGAPAGARARESGQGDRSLSGHSYAAGSTLSSPAGGAQQAGAGTALDELDQSALGLHTRHGEQLAAGSVGAGVPEEAAAAIVLTETSQLRGVVGDRVPLRFEPYEFFRETGRWLVATHMDQDAEYSVLEQARGIDSGAAHRALRVGVAQVSGREAEAAGHADAEAMLAAMQGDERAQIDGLLAVVAADSDLQSAMCGKQWATVAQLRAGPGFGALGYDDALAAYAEAYQRAAQKGYGGGDDDDGKPKKPRKAAKRKPKSQS